MNDQARVTNLEIRNSTLGEAEGRGRQSGIGGFAGGLLFFVILVSSFVITSIAQDATPPPDKRGVQLEFAPPPMENATISMGIYDSTGKLVRVLHQEAPPTDFFPALNGLITFWDGKDDSGKLMPAGKYRAKGFMVGEMDFEGVAFLFNDWLTDERAPHVLRVTKISVNDQGVLQGGYDIAGGGGGSFGGDATDSLSINTVNVTAEIKDGKILIKLNGAEKPVQLADGESPVDASAGFGGMVWAIVKTSTATEVRAYSADGAFVRRLAIAPGDPQPVSIKASPRAPEINLLEENAKMQRVRTLQLSTAPAAPQASGTDATPVSTWKVTFNRAVTFSDKLDQVVDQLKMAGGAPFVPQESIEVRLLPNPLEQDKVNTLDVSIGVDAKGSILKAPDGLPLCRVSETPDLKWAAMARESGSKIITIFQSDGAVVEQFKAARLANMMAFDAGDFDFDPAKVK